MLKLSNNGEPINQTIMTNDNYYAYLRVSTVKQGEGVSLEAQREAIEAFARNRSFTITRWVEEKQTAAKKGRPLFEAMLRDLRAGKAKGLIVHKIDRSARNFYDWAKIGELQDSGVEIHFASESVDFASRGGRLTADIQAVIAADYIRNLREETIKGLNGRLKQGLYPFKAPLGYLDTGKGNAKVICPKAGPLVKQMFELYAAGNHTYDRLRLLMFEKGLHSNNGLKLSRTCIAKTLGNPFYTGLIEIKRTGKTYRGIHDPLVSTSLYRSVQNVKLGRYTKKRLRRHNYLFQGIFRCKHCQRSMIGEKQRGHIYYRCHKVGCPTNCIRETAIASSVIEQLTVVQMPFEKIDIETSVGSFERTHCSGTGEALHMQKAELITQQNRLASALARGVIDDSVYLAQQKEIELELLECDSKLQDSSRLQELATNYRQFLEHSKSLCFLYEKADDNEKRQLLKLAFSNILIADKTLYFTTQDWILTLSNHGLVHLGTQHDTLKRSSQHLLNQANTRFLRALRTSELQMMLKLFSVHQSREQMSCENQIQEKQKL